MPTGIWLISYLALWPMVLLLSAFLAAMIRQQGGLYMQFVAGNPRHGPRVGSRAPALPGHDRLEREVPAPGCGKALALLFLSRGCGSCRGALNAAGRIASWKEVRTVLVIGNSEGDAEFMLDRAPREVVLDSVTLVDPKKEVFTAYNVRTTPYLVVLTPDGMVAAKGVATREESMDRMMRQAAARARMSARA